MRLPNVVLDPDEMIQQFIRKNVGTSSQDIMIATQVLFAAGLISREMTLIDDQLTLHFRSVPGLELSRKNLDGEGVINL